MQWNMTRSKRRGEGGITALVVGILATSLIAAVGMSVDVGNAYVQRQKLQTATDNAALAIAQDCALYRPTCYSANGNAPKSTAVFVVGQNISDANAEVVGTITPSSSSVTVRSTKVMPFSFGQLAGVSSKTATVSATATWDRAPKEGYPLLPMAVGYCQYKANAFPATQNILIRTDLLDATLKGLVATLNLLGLPLTNWFPAKTCTGSSGNTLNMSDGAVWLTALVDALDLFDISDMSMCNMKVTIFTTMLVSTVSPVIAPTACVNKLKIGSVAMMPIYESSSPLTVLSSSITLRIVGFAPFKITGWQEPGNVKNDPTATPSCLNILTLTCQGIQGHFVRSVVQDPDQVFAYDSAAPDLGGVKLATRLTD